MVQEVNLGADGLIPLEVRVRGHSGEEDLPLPYWGLWAAFGQVRGCVGTQGKRLNYTLLGQHANLWAGRRVR